MGGGCGCCAALVLPLLSPAYTGALQPPPRLADATPTTLAANTQKGFDVTAGDGGIFFYLPPMVIFFSLLHEIVDEKARGREGGEGGTLR